MAIRCLIVPGSFGSRQFVKSKTAPPTRRETELEPGFAGWQLAAAQLDPYTQIHAPAAPVPPVPLKRSASHPPHMFLAPNPTTGPALHPLLVQSLGQGPALPHPTITACEQTSLAMLSRRFQPSRSRESWRRALRCSAKTVQSSFRPILGWAALSWVGGLGWRLGWWVGHGWAGLLGWVGLG